MGGLAVRDPAMVNKASLLFLAWKLITSEEKWACICRERFLKHFKPKNHHITSSVWSGMKPHINFIMEHFTWSIGNGQTVSFYTDRWVDLVLADHWHIPSSILPSIDIKVADCIVNGKWCLPPYISQKDPVVANKIQCITINL